MGDRGGRGPYDELRALCSCSVSSWEADQYEGVESGREAGGAEKGLGSRFREDNSANNSGMRR